MKPELVHDLGAGEDDVEDDGGDHSGDEAVLVVVQLVVLVRKVDEPVEAHEPPNNWKNCMFWLVSQFEIVFEFPIFAGKNAKTEIEFLKITLEYAHRVPDEIDDAETPELTETPLEAVENCGTANLE